MKFYSTNDPALRISFRQAVLDGIAADGGLFMPEHVPAINGSIVEEMQNMQFSEIAYQMAYPFTKDDIPEHVLRSIIEDAYDFPVPLVKLEDDLYILELFHGPTLAFKDFGARFISRVMSYFLSSESTECTVLAATSGDTGSAVASGFYNVPGIRVMLLYPSGKVSEIQEKQLTTSGGNVVAVEVDGSFDDCQRLVKQAFADVQIKQYRRLTSANSINFARMLPQSFYYAYAWSRLKHNSRPVTFCVPSGNLGNLTAGMIARKMGVPIKRFIGAVNSNSVLSDYLRTGAYAPRPSVSTISNAMDVGSPSNMTRILSLFGGAYEEIKKVLISAPADDAATRGAIKEVFDKFSYIIDPHGAVGYHALKEFEKETAGSIRVILETAHPSKFPEVIQEVTGLSPIMPERLANIFKREKHSIRLSNSYDDFRKMLREVD